MIEQRGSVEAIRKIVELGSKISINEMANISEMANSLGGRLVAVDGDDDWCGTGRVIIPWPPKDPEGFVGFLDGLAKYWINYEVLINGITAPDYIVVDVSRMMRW